MDLDEESAAQILASMATPTTSTFSHFRNMSLDSPHTPNFPHHAPPSAVRHQSESQSQGQKEPNKPFALFEELLRHEDIVLYLTTQHMEPTSLFNLFCISRAFNYVVNSHLTSYMLSSARRWARLSHHRPSNNVSESSTRITRIPTMSSRPRSRRYEIEHQSASRHALQACGTEPTPPGIYSLSDVTTLLPFHNFLHLCVKDPVLRRLGARRGTSAAANSTFEASTPKQTAQVTRSVPGFRYLAFLLHRCRTNHSIIASLLKLGHRLPPHMPSVLTKLTLLLDLPTNNQRLSLMRNADYFTNLDLYVSLLFFIKLDMAFTDPIDGSGETSLRKLLLSMRGLEVLEKVLARKEGRTSIEVLQLWAKVHYRPPPGREEEFRGMSVLGVPWEELGMLGVEGWGQPLPRPGTSAHPMPKPEGKEDSMSAGPGLFHGLQAQGGAQASNPTSQAPPNWAAGNQPHAHQEHPASHGHAQTSQPGHQPTPAHLHLPPIGAAQATQQPHPAQAFPQPAASNLPAQSTSSSSTHTLAHPSQTTAGPAITSSTTTMPAPPAPSQPQAPPLHGPKPPANYTQIPSHPYARARLLRPDELVIGEAIRRRFPVHQRITEMMCYGYVDVRSGVDLPRSEGERLELLGRLEGEVLGMGEERVGKGGSGSGRGRGRGRGIREDGGNAGKGKGPMSDTGRQNDIEPSASAHDDGVGGSSAFTGKGKGKGRMTTTDDAEQSHCGTDDAMEED